jgi:hypothetical protein
MMRSIRTFAVLAAAGGAASADAAGRLGGGAALDVSPWRILAALILCVIIAVLAALMIRQRGGRIALATLLPRLDPGRRAIEVVETRRLSPHADLCVVRHDGREYLLLLLAGDARVLNESAVSSASDAKSTPCG